MYSLSPSAFGRVGFGLVVAALDDCIAYVD